MDQHTGRHDRDDELVVGYAPAFRDRTDWRPVFRQRQPVGDGGIMRRVIWEHVGDRHQRLIVDVEECVSAIAAFDRSEAARQDWNVPAVTGPRELGPRSFAHPEGRARSLYFTRANLAVWLFSTGRHPIAIEPWAISIVTELDSVNTTESNQDFTLKQTADQSGSRGRPVPFHG
jgi:hypothetical protein